MCLTLRWLLYWHKHSPEKRVRPIIIDLTLSISLVQAFPGGLLHHLGFTLLLTAQLHCAVVDLLRRGHGALTGDDRRAHSAFLLGLGHGCITLWWRGSSVAWFIPALRGSPTPELCTSWVFHRTFVSLTLKRQPDILVLWVMPLPTARHRHNTSPVPPTQTQICAQQARQDSPVAETFT